jgi:hypothetical protein
MNTNINVSISISISLNEFVERSRKTSELPIMLDYFHDRIIHIIHTWIPITQTSDTDLSNRLYQIEEIDQLSKWIVQIRNKNGIIQERDISYGCWIIWYLLFPEWALRILDQFVNGIGCWSDIKYICGFLKRKNIGSRIFETDKENIINVLLEKMVNKLYEDKRKWTDIMSNYFDNRLQFFSSETPTSSRKPLLPRPIARKHISLVAKWIPRESSKYGWLFIDMVNIWAKLNGENINQPRFQRKWCQLFRKTISHLNRELDTLEIKLCSKQWEEIDPALITKGSMKSHFSVLLHILSTPPILCDKK